MSTHIFFSGSHAVDTVVATLKPISAVWTSRMRAECGSRNGIYFRLRLIIFRFAVTCIIFKQTSMSFHVRTECCNGSARLLGLRGL